MKRIAFILAATLLLSSCSSVPISPDGEGALPVVAMAKTFTPTPIQVEEKEMSEALSIAASDFGWNLLSALTKGENRVISPLSVMDAMGMAALGADGETRTQMENVLFGGMAAEEGAKYLYPVSTRTPEVLQVTNSLWLNAYRADFTPNEDYLSAAAGYYDAAVNQLPFDAKAVKKINTHVSDNTDGMIPKLLDDLDPSMVMLLLNTVLFDGKWEKEYKDYNITTDSFTSYTGTVTDREMLHSGENAYFRLGKGQGFLRPYKDGYSFVGLLPDAGEDVYAYAASLEGEDFIKAVTAPSRETVQVTIPSFTVEYDTTLNDALKALGMTDVFDGGKADLTGMGECATGNLFVSQVIHKTKIELSKEGTKAAAATGVLIATTAVPVNPPKVIRLDRPFVFAIIDTASGFPLFCGVIAALD